MQNKMLTKRWPIIFVFEMDMFTPHIQRVVVVHEINQQLRPLKKIEKNKIFN